MRKNPKNEPLRIVFAEGEPPIIDKIAYATMLTKMMECQAILIKAGKDSAMPHFIAIVKELERLFGFRFEVLKSDNQERSSPSAELGRESS